MKKEKEKEEKGRRRRSDDKEEGRRGWGEGRAEKEREERRPLSREERGRKEGRGRRRRKMYIYIFMYRSIVEEEVERRMAGLTLLLLGLLLPRHRPLSQLFPLAKVPHPLTTVLDHSLCSFKWSDILLGLFLWHFISFQVSRPFIIMSSGQSAFS